MDRNRVVRSRRHIQSTIKNHVVPVSFGAALLLSLTVVVWADSVWQMDLREEFAKDAVQLLMLTIVGALLVAVLEDARVRREAALKDRERLRDEARAIFDGIYHDVVLAYNQMKGVRRMLRAIGINAPGPALSESERVTFVGQLRTLNDVQLALEMAKREARIRRKAFARLDPPDDSDAWLTRHIEEMEHYVNAIVDEWEEMPDQAHLHGARLSRMTSLQQFLGDPNASGGIRMGRAFIGHNDIDKATAGLDPRAAGPTAQLRRIEQEGDRRFT